MSNRKFNVGDKVQLTPKFQKMYNCIGDKQGEVIKIGFNGNRSVYWVSFENKKFIGEYYSYQLDRAPKFKEGDKVIFTPKAKQWLIDEGYWGADKGDNSHQPITIDPNKVYTISQVFSWVQRYTLEEIYNVLVSDEDLLPAIDSKFHVGDEVVLTEKAKKWLLNNGYVNVDLHRAYTIQEVTTFYGKTYRLKGIVGVVFFDDDLMSAMRTDSNKEYNNLTENEYHNRLKSNFEEVCNRYLEEFCNRHDYAYHPEDWIDGDVGGIIEIADMFVTMGDIRYDIDNDIPVDKFSDWYWNSVEHSELGLAYMNYPSYCEGAPDHYTKEQMQSIREGQMRISKAKEDLRKMMDELGGDFSKLLF